MESSGTQDQQPKAQHFLIRISLLGPFCIEWEGYTTPFPKKRLSGRGAAPALGLLKALLGQPDRFATRDWLLEQFWPESAIKSAQERLDDVASALRTLLRPEGSDLKILHYIYGSNGKGSGYRLEGYPLIWVDADALAWYVEQATRFERFGQDALPLWEQAHHLGSRGAFLPEEIYSDWAKPRREELAGQYRQCMHRLTTLLRERGATEQAMLRLRTYWQANPTDEDALRPLMELLGEQERYQEAEEDYQQFLLALTEQGDEQRQSRLPDARTRDIREYLRTKQIQREHVTSSHSLAPSLSGIHLERDTLRLKSPLKSQTNAQGILEVIQQLEGHNFDMNHFSRRETIAALLGLVGTNAFSLEWWERLANPRPWVMNTEAFTYFQQLLEIGWGLSNAGELHTAEQVLMTFLPRMFQLAPHQQEAASIAAEGLRLQGILAAHQQKMPDKLAICLQAVEFARKTNDRNILIAQLTELAVAFRYAHQSANSFRTYQEALSYCQQGQISPLVSSRIYAASAPTFAINGYIKEARSSIEKAYDSFPATLDSEPSAFSADNQLFMIDYYQGLLYLVLNEPEKAYIIFEQAITRSYENQMPERWRLIIINYQGLAAILSKQRDQYSQCLEYGLSGSLLLGSKKRFDEAVSIYQHYTPQNWQDDSRMKQIAERFQLEREIRREEELEIW